MWLGQNIKKGSRDSDHALYGVVYRHRIGFDTVYLHAKFDMRGLPHLYLVPP